jgi:hypothetical protein
MSNQFTRRRYDQSELTTFDTQNRDSNLLLLDRSVKENQNACYAAAGVHNAKSQVPRPIYEGYNLDFGKMADIENRVTNRHKELNNDAGRTNNDFKELNQ